jgi:hypothetical protein
VARRMAGDGSELRPPDPATGSVLGDDELPPAFEPVGVVAGSGGRSSLPSPAMRRATGLLAVLCLLLVACSDDAGDEAGGGGDEAVLDEDAGAMVRALGLVSADDADAVVIVNDYAAAGEALDLDRPAPDEADEESVADWFIPLTVGRDDVVGGLVSNSFLGTRVVEDEAWRDEVGWAPVDVDLAVEVQPTEDAVAYHAFIGDFDADAIEDAVTDEDNPWSDELETVEHSGTEYYRWGDDEEQVDPERITVVRPLGQGGSMAVLDGAVLWGDAADALEDGIDAATGATDRLADQEDLAPLAEAMDGLGAMGALFSTDPAVFGGGRLPDLDDVDATVPDDPVLDPYEAFATGVRTGEDGPQVLIALLHDDEDDAEDNVENLEEVVAEAVSVQGGQPWSELVSIDEVETDGPVLTAVLDVAEPQQATMWTDLVYTRDTLLAS